MASDLFFFPSLEEGFGMVAAEAAAAGLPIVATNLPAIREACPPGHHRFMFCPNDDQAAAAHIETILGDTDLRKALVEEGRRWVQRYSFRNTLDQIVSIYRNTP
jgi:glycosyltransferase involved in cell wall biosynthesis